MYLDCVFVGMGGFTLGLVFFKIHNTYHIYIYIRLIPGKLLPKPSEENLSIICVPDVRPLQVAFVHQNFVVSSPYSMFLDIHSVHLKNQSPSSGGYAIIKHSHNIPANIFWGISTWWKKNFL